MSVKFYNFLVSFLLSISVAIAAERTIDGSSAKSTEKSLTTMTTSLSPDERPQLAMAIMRIQLAEFGSASEVPPDFESVNYEYLSSKQDGLNYSQILILADESPIKASISK